MIFDWNDLNYEDVLLIFDFFKIILPLDSVDVDRKRSSIIKFENLNNLLTVTFIWKLININVTSNNYDSDN